MEYPYKIGTLLYIREAYETDDQLIYKARIADMTPDYISIELPISEHGGKPGIFPEGAELNVWYFSKKGIKTTFKCTMLTRKRGHINFTLITHPHDNEIKASQRREFLRVSANEEIAIHPVNQQIKPFITHTADLSGGGLAFIHRSNTILRPGMEVKWWLNLPITNGQILHPTGMGTILRVIEPNEKGLPYRYPLQFTSIDEQSQQMIIKYCFSKQIQYREKLKE